MAGEGGRLMDEAFQTTLEVRLFDCDAQGHLAGAAYLNYANHALWSCLRSAGVDVSALLRDGFGPVHLETKVRFLSEFRAGDILTLTCTLTFDGGKTYRVRNEFRKDPNTLGAEVESVCGLLDLSSRRLHPHPAEEWRKRAGRTDLLGLTPSP
jgi:acyl-CoA thioester hydrolase